jgi:hypothetical protein
MSTLAREVGGCLGGLAIILIGTVLAVASESSEGPRWDLRYHQSSLAGDRVRQQHEQKEVKRGGICLRRAEGSR